MIKVVLLLVAAVAVAQAGKTPKPVTYTATALGANQVPTPVISKLTSTIKFTVTADCVVTGTASVKNVKDFTEAHIHIGNAAMSGNVILQVWIPQLTTQPLTGHSFSWPFVQNATDIMNTESKANCATFLTNLNAGSLYYNVHTLAFPEGEARGQVRKA